MKFKGKTVVVTGAAKGIGKSIAQKFSENGANVIILDFDEVAGKDFEQELLQNGQDALFVQTDVSNYESLFHARNKAIEKFGKVDILVINAGISYKHNIDEVSIEEWDRVLKINLSGSFYTLKAFEGDFSSKVPEDHGKIIFITSGSAITGTGGGPHYAASKAGQHGLMRNIAKEYGPNGVNVNAIAPRVIETDILHQLYPTEESRTELRNKIPIGRFGLPEDIANLAIFLASEESSYIHGQIILSDGGRTY